MKPTISLRNATIHDAKLLQQWDQQEHVIASDPNDDWNWEVELHRKPTWREQLIAELNDRPIGFIQIIDPAMEESHYWGEVSDDLRAIDIWIGDANDLGKGYGTMMMKLAINRIFKIHSVKTILIDPLASNVKAHRFYEGLGFAFLRKQQFGDDDCLVYQLKRADWEAKGETPINH